MIYEQRPRVVDVRPDTTRPGHYVVTFQDPPRTQVVTREYLDQYFRPVPAEGT